MKTLVAALIVWQFCLVGVYLYLNRVVTGEDTNGYYAIKYVNGVKYSYTAWHPNGRISVKGRYLNGKEHGIWVFYHDNGQLAQVVQCLDGVSFGPSAAWYENGEKMREGHHVWYKRGEYTGSIWVPERMWDENGNDVGVVPPKSSSRNDPGRFRRAYDEYSKKHGFERPWAWNDPGRFQSEWARELAHTEGGVPMRKR